jgi:hypothetical protein
LQHRCDVLVAGAETALRIHELSRVHAFGLVILDVNYALFRISGHQQRASGMRWGCPHLAVFITVMISYRDVPFVVWNGQ